MKKVLIILFMLFIPFFVKAETCDIENITIESISLEETHGEASELNAPVIEGLNIKLDLKLTEVGDYVKYKITINNGTTDNYEFNKNNLVTNSDYIKYEFDNNDNEIILAHETKDIYITVKYNKKVSNDSFTDGVFNETKNVKNVLNIEELVNPKTGYFDIRIIIYLVLVTSIIVYLYSSKKTVNKGYYVMLLLISLIIPIKLYALCKCEISVESKIEIEQFNNRSIYNVVTDESILDSVKSTYVSATTGVDFTEPSSDTNGKGLYIFTSTKDDTYPVYYYRGNVSDNNVLFGGFCWKILRTTSTGGTKLVYNGLPSDGKCNNSGADTLVAVNVKYSAASNLSYFGYAYQAGHSFKNVKITNITNGSVFAEDVTYEDGKYILSDERYIKDGDLGNNPEELLQNHHYSCFKVEGEDCTSINFVYMTRGGYLYYTILSNGEKIEDAIEADLLNSPNTTDSTIKKYVENWYGNNLTEFTSYLEDEVYCNDRSIGVYNGWSKNGSIADPDKLTFGGLKRALDGKPSLVCKNNTDKFTTSTDNGNGKNQYPVGLITLDEALMAGFAWNKDDDTNYLYNGKVWWTMSPSLNSVALNYMGVLHSMADNVHTTYVSSNAGGVRPLVSLKNSVKINGGDGTGDNPFTVVMD